MSVPSAVQPAFLESARLLARGGEFDAKLIGLADQTRTLTGATACLVYLLDNVAGVLIPAGTPLLGDEDHERLTVEADDLTDPVARAARERQPVASSLELASRYALLGDDLTELRCVPLVIEEPGAGQEVQGALLAGFEGGVGDDDARAASISALLAGMADLAAVAVRMARLDRALLERSDWYDRVAHTDPLTGLANRRTFDRMLELELARATRQGTGVSVVVFDVDGLAQINAARGANVGDDVLRLVASTLADSVRLVDTVARLGADEFGIIAPGSAGSGLARRVLEALMALRPIEGGDRIHVRAGAARFPEDGGTAVAVLERADAALRGTKQGHPFSAEHGPDMEGSTPRRAEKRPREGGIRP